MFWIFKYRENNAKNDGKRIFGDHFLILRHSRFQSIKSIKSMWFCGLKKVQDKMWIFFYFIIKWNYYENKIENH